MSSKKNTGKNRIVFLPKAFQDLERIYLYFESNDLFIERELLEEDFELQFERIRSYPNAYPRFDDSNIGFEGVRKSIMDRYVIIYLYLDVRSIVVILRIVHSKSNIETILQ